jgi:hypothetical protein
MAVDVHQGASGARWWAGGACIEQASYLGGRIVATT